MLPHQQEHHGREQAVERVEPGQPLARRLALDDGVCPYHVAGRGVAELEPQLEADGQLTYREVLTEAMRLLGASEGEEDESGTLNYIGAEQVKRAAALVRSGERISLALPWPPFSPMK